MFVSDSTDADEPSSAHYQIWHRIDDLRDTAADAYAVASLAVQKLPSGERCGVISVQGAERGDPQEARWFQRISFGPGSGQTTGHECWPFELSRLPNALSPFDDAQAYDKAELGASPNGGPAEPSDNSNIPGGPPSVS